MPGAVDVVELSDDVGRSGREGVVFDDSSAQRYSMLGRSPASEPSEARGASTSEDASPPSLPSSLDAGADGPSPPPPASLEGIIRLTRRPYNSPWRRLR